MDDLSRHADTKDAIVVSDRTVFVVAVQTKPGQAKPSRKEEEAKKLHKRRFSTFAQNDSNFV